MGARGPKPGEYGEGRTIVLPVRVSPEERKQYERAAKRAGLTLSAWIRAMIQAGMGAEKK